MLDSLEQIQVGNIRLLDWAISLVIVVSAMVLGRLIQMLIGRYARKAVGGTKWEDLLIRPIQGPLLFFVTVVGFWTALVRLDLDPGLQLWIDRVGSFLIVLPVAWALARFLDAFLKQFIEPYLRRASDLDTQLIGIVRRLTVIAVWTIGLVIAVDNAGYDVTAVLAGLGIGGLAFALAGQETISNFFGGVVIFADRPFRVGDRIQIRGVDRREIDGVVEAIGLRSTRIRSRYEGRQVIIPNSVVANRNIVNVDSESGRQMFQVFRLAPNTSADKIERALEILKSSAKQAEETKDVVVTGFISANEISRDVMLLYWILPEFSNLKTRTKINLAIVRSLDEEGIQFTDRAEYHYQKDWPL